MNLNGVEIQVLDTGRYFSIDDLCREVFDRWEYLMNAKGK